MSELLKMLGITELGEEVIEDLISTAKSLNVDLNKFRLQACKDNNYEEFIVGELAKLIGYKFNDLLAELLADTEPHECLKLKSVKYFGYTYDGASVEFFAILNDDEDEFFDITNVIDELSMGNNQNALESLLEECALIN